MDICVKFEKTNFRNGVRFEITVSVLTYCVSSNITQVRKLLKQIRESDTPEVEHQFIDIMRAFTEPVNDFYLLVSNEDRKKIKKYLEKLGV